VDEMEKVIFTQPLFTAPLFSFHPYHYYYFNDFCNI